MKTPISYYGGKQTMLKYIRPLIPPHNLYCEPFAGGAPVFFDKDPVRINVINDLNSELINFYKVVVSHMNKLKKEISQTLHSRKQHSHALYIYNNPTFFNEIQRAWAVWVLSKESFSSILNAAFSVSKTQSKKPLKVQNAKLIFENNLQSLLEQATIECDDAFKIINRYDTPDSLFFLDPPYVGCNMGHYANMFNEQSLNQLLVLCSELKGKFILTMYPNQLIEEFASKNNWIIVAIDRVVTASINQRRKQKEWIVYNYNI